MSGYMPYDNSKCFMKFCFSRMLCVCVYGVCVRVWGVVYMCVFVRGNCVTYNWVTIRRTSQTVSLTCGWPGGTVRVRAHAELTEAACKHFAGCSSQSEGRCHIHLPLQHNDSYLPASFVVRAKVAYYLHGMS